MSAIDDIAYLVYDTESVVDGALLARALYPGEDLEAQAAVQRFREETSPDDPEGVFVPVTFHVPVAVAVAKVGRDYRLRDVALLDAPRFDPQEIVSLFWRGVEAFRVARLVDFNGRGFDLPLLTLSAFRFGISCPRYFADERFGFRYRFTDKHIDLMEWMTEYGAFRMKGGLDLLAKMLGSPGKMDTRGSQVEAMYHGGEVQRINDYCLHDTLDTYFVFLRTRVLLGELTIEEEQRIVGESRAWIADKISDFPALEQYLENFGDWDGRPFR